jgi:hypothetical protein
VARDAHGIIPFMDFKLSNVGLFDHFDERSRPIVTFAWP